MAPLLAVLVAAAAVATPPMPEDGPCVCADARVNGAWCGAHDRGYIAGVEIDSAMLYETLDAHGHDVDPERVRARCATCRTVIDTDGYCSDCGWGFVDEQLYASRLTWLIARGTAVHPRTIACATCVTHAHHRGWCDDCAIGRVGPVTWSDRALYDAAAVEHVRLLRAVEASRSCEGCGPPAFLEGTCRTCRKRYRGGVRVDAAAPARRPAGFLGGW